MSLLELGQRSRFAMKAAIPVSVGMTAGVTRFGLVTPKLGYPYVLDRVTLAFGGAGITRLGFQVYISDNNDLTDLAALTGDPVFVWRGDVLLGDLPIPYLLYAYPTTWHPHARVATPGTYLKALIDDAPGGGVFVVFYNLQPL